MLEFGFSKGVWFYVASFVERDYLEDDASGLSVILLRFRITWIDQPMNWNRKEWVIPRSAWRGRVEGW